MLKLYKMSYKISLDYIIRVLFYIAIIFFTIFIINPHVAAYDLSNHEVLPANLQETPGNNISQIFKNFEIKPHYLAPRVGFYTSQKEELFFNSFRGSTLLLSIWASWCQNCISDLQNLNRIQDYLNYNQVENLKIIAISNDFKSIDVLKNILIANDIELLQLYIDQKRQLSEKLDVNSLPMTFIINNEGYITHRINKQINWSDPDVISYLMHITQNNNKNNDKNKDTSIVPSNKNEIKQDEKTTDNDKKTS